MQDDNHCRDHTDTMVCLKGLKNTLESVKKDGHSKLAMVGQEVHSLWEAMNKKLDATTFKWFMGLFVMVIIVILGVQWTKLDSIDNKMDQRLADLGEKMHKVEVTQAVVAERLKITGEVNRRIRNGD